MAMRLHKLDRRYDGHDRFTHRVEFTGWRGDVGVMRVKQWIAARNWLWTQFGPSSELYCARPEYFGGQQPQWAWDADKSAIYLADQALALFVLKKDAWEIYENL